jgi:hypothetical protein
VIITLLARLFDILDERYSNMILIGSLLIQTFLLIIGTVILILKTRKINGVKIPRYQFYDTMVKGDTNIIPENISPTNPRKRAIFKIFLAIENISDPPDIGIFKMNVGKNIPDIKDQIVNLNSGLVDNNFIFDADIIVEPGEKINFRLKKDTVVKLFFLGEFYLP